MSRLAAVLTLTLAATALARTDAGVPPPPAAPPETAMSPTPVQLVDAVSATLEGVERELGAMPFFVRPMVRSGFGKRTGLSPGDWKELLQALRREVQAGATPAQVVQAHPKLRKDLEGLAENYRTAPERAKKGMGAEGERLRELQETARQREAAVKALHAWLGGA